MNVSFIPSFVFWLLVTFGDKVTKIRKNYLIFFYILQDKMDQMENHTKYQKTKDVNIK